MIIRKDVTLSINEGPSKHDLFNAMVYAYSKRHPFTVDFTVIDQDTRRCSTHSVRVQSIAHEDGSGSSFNLVLASDTLGTVQAYYDAAKRTGTIRAHEDFATDNNNFELSLRQVYGDAEAERRLKQKSDDKHHQELYRKFLAQLKEQEGLTLEQYAAFRSWISSHPDEL